MAPATILQSDQATAWRGIGEGGAGAGPERVTVNTVTGRAPRNAQPVWNIGARSYVSLFHDGRVEALDPADPADAIRSPAGSDLPVNVSNPLAAQAFFPVTSLIEMAGQYGEDPIANAAHHEDRPEIWEALVHRVGNTPEYLDMLNAAYPEIMGAEDVAYIHIADVLAAFQTTAFLDTPTDPSALDRREMVAARVPSGLPPQPARNF